LADKVGSPVVPVTVIYGTSGIPLSKSTISILVFISGIFHYPPFFNVITNLVWNVSEALGGCSCLGIIKQFTSV